MRLFIDNACVGGGSLQYSSCACGSDQDPKVNVPLCTAGGDQTEMHIVTDGTGGAIPADGWIIVMAVLRQFMRNVLMPKVGCCGSPTVCLSVAAIAMPIICGWSLTVKGALFLFGKIIGMGTMIFTRSDSMNRVWPNGHQEEWRLQKFRGPNRGPNVISDGKGGAFFAWRDQRTAPSDSYIQWINAAGTPQWAVNGINISNADKHQYYPTIVRDAQGGIIVAWMDDRNTYYHFSIYAQRLTLLPYRNGNPTAWRFSVILKAIYSRRSSAIKPVERLSLGEEIFQLKISLLQEIYAQRLNASGQDSGERWAWPLATTNNVGSQ